MAERTSRRTASRPVGRFVNHSSDPSLRVEHTFLRPPGRLVRTVGSLIAEGPFRAKAIADAGLLVAFRNRDDNHHARAVDITMGITAPSSPVRRQLRDCPSPAARSVRLLIQDESSPGFRLQLQPGTATRSWPGVSRTANLIRPTSPDPYQQTLCSPPPGDVPKVLLQQQGSDSNLPPRGA